MFIIKIQGHEVPVEWSLIYRIFGASLVFMAMLLYLRPANRPRRADLLPIAAFGLLNFAIGYLLMYYAALWASAALITVVFALKTIITPLCLRLFLRTPLHPLVLAGGAVGVCGVIIIMLPALYDLTGDPGILTGAALAFMGAIVASMGDVFSARNAARKVDPIYANSIGFGVAGLFLLGLALLRGTAPQISLAPAYIGALLYLMIIASCLAWICYLKLVQNIGAGASSYMVALFPVIGGIASVLIGESAPTPYLIIGCLTTSFGAMLALGGPRYGVRRARG